MDFPSADSDNVKLYSDDGLNMSELFSLVIGFGRAERFGLRIKRVE